VTVIWTQYDAYPVVDIKITAGLLSQRNFNVNQDVITFTGVLYLHLSESERMLRIRNKSLQMYFCHIYVFC